VSFRALLALAVAVLASVSIAACAGGATPAAPAAGATATPKPAGERPNPLRIGLIPNIAPDRQRTLYEPFRLYMERTLGQPVETFVATDYTGVVEAMAADRIDLAYFGALTYLQAEQRADVYPIVTEIDRETGTSKYYSAIIVKADSRYQRLADLQGQRIGFGDINSTSGSLYPRIMLDRAGFTNFTDPQRYVYTGGHDATLAAVINGSVEAGGIEKRIMQRAFDAGTFQANQVRILEEALVEGYPWVVRAKLDPAFVERIKNAFLQLEDQDLLRLMRATRYTTVTKESYNEAREQARRLGLLR
jgi:phosphonate transport system substrate-binding protein